MTKDEAILYLWQIIDDIDTVSDMAKSNDTAYRNMIEKLQAKRWKTGITTALEAILASLPREQTHSVGLSKMKNLVKMVNLSAEKPRWIILNGVFIELEHKKKKIKNDNI